MLSSMAHTNPGHNRAIMPYVVNVQSRRLDSMRSRVVIPLMRLARPREAGPRLNPEFMVRAGTLFLHVLPLFAAPLSVPGPVVASLAADDDASRTAIDAVITPAFG
jgi:toxin CcdB